jgi:long-chain acyl-CoA synthetase
VKAWVIPTEGEVLTLTELRRFCQEKLAAYKIPLELEIIELIPRSPVGKVLRRELVRVHIEQHK